MSRRSSRAPAGIRQFSLQILNTGNVHVISSQDPLAGIEALPVRLRHPAVDRLPHHGRNGNSALARYRNDPVVSLIVKQDL